MGRRVPHDNISLIEHFVYLSFFFVGLVASMAITIALCSVRFRRKKPPQPPTLSNDQSETKALNASTPQSTTMEAAAVMSPEPLPRMSEAKKLDLTTETDDDDNNNNNDMLAKELPLPPVMQGPKDSSMPCSMKRETSTRRMSFNLSMKIPRTLSSMARNRDHNNKEELEMGKKTKMKAEESVWMKTIILGEKCVPDEEEEEEAIIYEGKGKRVSFSAYHPKKSNSMSLSRQWSYIDPDALSVPHQQSHQERINDI